MLSPTELEKKVLDTIRSGKIGMRSRTYFILRTLLIGVGAASILLLSLFVLSFIFFSLRESGIHFLLEFGSPGLALFFGLFPWPLLALSASLILATEVILRHTTTAYRFSAVRLFGSMLAGVAALGFLLLVTPLHPTLLSAADKDTLPLLKPWYAQVHIPHTEHGIYRGDILHLSTTTFMITYNDHDRDSDRGTWIIIPPPTFDLTTLTPGEKVFVAGYLESSTTIQAFGIRVVPPRH